MFRGAAHHADARATAWALGGTTAAGATVAALAMRSAIRKARYDAEQTATRRTAEIAERTREEARQLVHGSVLQTVEALCAPDAHTRFELLRAQAARDARILRAYLDGSATAGDGLDSMIEQLADEARGRGLAVEVIRETTRDGLPAIEAQVLDSLKMAASEALSNTAKHAGVASATLRWKMSGAGLMLSVGDAGAGFDPRGTHHQDGFGLSRSIAGISRVGGVATIDTTPGGGTVVHLWVPSAGGWENGWSARNTSRGE